MLVCTIAKVMKSQSTSIVLLLFVLIVLVAASASYQNSFDKITVREFEMVDENGKKRASIKIEPEGEIVFRMMDESGAIRVKISGGEDGSGLVLLNGNTDPGIHALVKKSATTLTVTGPDGKKREY